MAGFDLAPIDAKFIAKINSLGSSQNKSTPSRLGQSSSSIKLGLRTGAQLYVKAIQDLNEAGTAINLARNSLEKIDKVTDKLVALADQASRATTGSGTRGTLDLKFKQLGKEFREIVDGAKINGKSVLSVDDLKEVFADAGLNEKTSDQIGGLLDQLVSGRNDGDLASETAEAAPLNLPSILVTQQLPSSGAASGGQTGGTGGGFDDPPAGAGGPTGPGAGGTSNPPSGNPLGSNLEITYTRQLSKPTNPEKILDGELKSRSNAYGVKSGLIGLKKQVHENLKALDKATEILADNVTLARATGLALLSVSDQVTDATKASDIARLIKNTIRDEVRDTAVLANAHSLGDLLDAAVKNLKN